MKKLVSLSMLCLILSTSCKKEESSPEPESGPEPEPIGQITLDISYKVDGQQLIANCIDYQNKAGNPYSITTFNYYLSRISLIKADSSIVEIKDVYYVDAFSKQQLIVLNPPTGNFIGIKFNLGLDSTQNKSQKLTATNDNINMAWPDNMGGGYHFVKMEGYFKDEQDKTFGYAMHIGSNDCLTSVKIFRSISIAEKTKNQINLEMNINEWFKNPNIYDFNSDGNYIMGNTVKMKKFAENGKDVFSFRY